MRSVTIDGVQYVPKVEGKIGIAITTHNRPKVLEDAQKNQLKYLPDGAHIVVIDDGSTVPVQVQEGVALIRHEKAQGIARAKNSCIAALIDAGCDHLFLFDDDTWPSQEGWWKPYVRSPEPHLMYLWGEGKVYQDDRVHSYLRPKGCMLYLERRVVDRVGGMDPRFGTWGYEHENLSDRIYSAGLTTCRYQDVPDSKGLFFASDEKGIIQSSVPEVVRLAAKPQLAEEQRDSDAYIGYRDVPQVDGVEKCIALSVLVPSVHTRWDTFGRKIQEQLFGQHSALSTADQARVEILMVTDTKTINLGEKRNQMVRLASGEYVVFVDDDDRLEPDYLPSLLKATESGADVITFQVKVSLDGNAPKLCRYSLKYMQDENLPGEYRRIPNHICAVKRSIVLRTPFPSKLCGEDKDYAIDLRPLLKTEHAIERVLYHYDYNRMTTETQLSQRYQQVIVRRSKQPTVDVIVLSKASNDSLRAMTQATIDTCISGSGTYSVNVIVVEQAEGVRYKNAITLRKSVDFNYNALMNLGASKGTSAWIMFANNDLLFEPNWLKPLLDARHELVSPLNPGDSRQSGVVRNEIGIVNGRNLSGWCYMMSRNLWNKIGGLDDCVSYWCSDDVVIEQAKANGVKPMLVPASRVKHLVSKTGGREPTDDMTWDNVQIFEKKYGIKKFPGDARYNDYKRRKGIPL